MQKIESNTPLSDKKIENINKKIEAIDKQFSFLKKLIDDLNNEKLR